MTMMLTFMTTYIKRYQYKDGEGGVRGTYLADNNITTYLIEGRVEVSGDYYDAAHKQLRS